MFDPLKANMPQPDLAQLNPEIESTQFWKFGLFGRVHFIQKMIN